MGLEIRPVRSDIELKNFITIPWSIYYNDPFWVPPLLDDRYARVDVGRNPFWKNASRELWIAWMDGRCVGTIASIIDEGRIKSLGAPVGSFGFFECYPDQQVANALINAAGSWLRERGMQIMRGPYNPSNEDEAGILVEGFQTRPALLEGHNPPYYRDMIEKCGMVKYRDLVARLWRREPGTPMEDQMPGKMLRVASRVAQQRSDLHVRQMNVKQWDSEIELAWSIFTTSLMSLPERVHVSLENFRTLADSFRGIMDPRLGLVAEIRGKPVGFVLALPDVNEALQKVISHKTPRRLNLIDMLRLFLYTRHLTRATYKILMVLPDYQGRGVEAILSAELARMIWNMKFREVDMSLTGEENIKSNRFQENLGFRVYRRYRVYQKELG